VLSKSLLSRNVFLSFSSMHHAQFPMAEPLQSGEAELAPESALEKEYLNQLKAQHRSELQQALRSSHLVEGLDVHSAAKEAAEHCRTDVLHALFTSLKRLCARSGAIPDALNALPEQLDPRSFEFILPWSLPPASPVAPPSNAEAAAADELARGASLPLDALTERSLAHAGIHTAIDGSFDRICNEWARSRALQLDYSAGELQHAHTLLTLVPSPDSSTSSLRDDAARLLRCLELSSDAPPLARFAHSPDRTEFLLHYAHGDPALASSLLQLADSSNEALRWLCNHQPSLSLRTAMWIASSNIHECTVGSSHALGMAALQCLHALQSQPFDLDDLKSARHAVAAVRALPELEHSQESSLDLCFSTLDALLLLAKRGIPLADLPRIGQPVSGERIQELLRRMIRFSLQHNQEESQPLDHVLQECHLVASSMVPSDDNAGSSEGTNCSPTTLVYSSLCFEVLEDGIDPSPWMRHLDDGDRLWIARSVASSLLFEHCASVTDGNVDKASEIIEQCKVLNQRGSDEHEDLFDFVHAMHIFASLDAPVSPREVWSMPDKTNAIRVALSSAKDDGAHAHHRVRELGRLLRVPDYSISAVLAESYLSCGNATAAALALLHNKADAASHYWRLSARVVAALEGKEQSRNMREAVAAVAFRAMPLDDRTYEVEATCLLRMLKQRGAFSDISDPSLIAHLALQADNEQLASRALAFEARRDSFLSTDMEVPLLRAGLRAALIAAGVPHETADLPPRECLNAAQAVDGDQFMFACAVADRLEEAQVLSAADDLDPTEFAHDEGYRTASIAHRSSQPNASAFEQAASLAALRSVDLLPYAIEHVVAVVCSLNASARDGDISQKAWQELLASSGSTASDVLKACGYEGMTSASSKADAAFVGSAILAAADEDSSELDAVQTLCEAVESLPKAIAQNFNVSLLFGKEGVENDHVHCIASHIESLFQNVDVDCIEGVDELSDALLAVVSAASVFPTAALTCLGIQGTIVAASIGLMRQVSNLSASMAIELAQRSKRSDEAVTTLAATVQESTSGSLLPPSAKAAIFEAAAEHGNHEWAHQAAFWRTIASLDQHSIVTVQLASAGPERARSVLERLLQSAEADDDICKALQAANALVENEIFSGDVKELVRAAVGGAGHTHALHLARCLGKHHDMSAVEGAAEALSMLSEQAHSAEEALPFLQLARSLQGESSGTDGALLAAQTTKAAPSLARSVGAGELSSVSDFETVFDELLRKCNTPSEPAEVLGVWTQVIDQKAVQALQSQMIVHYANSDELLQWMHGQSIDERTPGITEAKAREALQRATSLRRKSELKLLMRRMMGGEGDGLDELRLTEEERREVVTSESCMSALLLQREPSLERDSQEVEALRDEAAAGRRDEWAAHAAVKLGACGLGRKAGGAVLERMRVAEKLVTTEGQRVVLEGVAKAVLRRECEKGLEERNAEECAKKCLQIL